MRLTHLTAVASATALLFAAGCGNGEADRVTAEQLAERCKGSPYLTLSEDRKSIKYDFLSGTQPAEYVYNCLLKETDAPPSIDNKVQGTRPIDGEQNASWPGWEMTWSNGMYSAGTRILLEQR